MNKIKLSFKISLLAVEVFFILISNGFVCYSQGLPTNLSCETATILNTNYPSYYYNYTSDISKCGSPLYFAFYTNGNAGNNVLYAGGPGDLRLYGPFTSYNQNTCNSLSNPSTLISTNPFNNNCNFVCAAVGWYIMEIQYDGCGYGTTPSNGFQMNFKSIPIIAPEPPPCQDCITSFSPTPGKYIVSAWVKEAGASMNTTSYSNSSINISFTNAPDIETLSPSGQIIDGWQRVEGVIEVPLLATDIHLSFETSTGTSYYDDIRFHPLDGSMMSYVYDPISLRLMAELDERNYATLYEYDEEGKLIRVKKETEKGIMTIQENRDNITK